MTYSFHPDAENELNQSIDYYEALMPNLGWEFAEEVYNTIQRILQFPNAWQTMDGDIRRCLTNRFPYGVIYYVNNDAVVILAVMQLKQKPEYWKKRRI